jgi:putative Mg2+ transporter-C (MgtC) family protein
MLEMIWEEFTLGLPDGREFWRISLRLSLAMLFGSVIGIQRELSGKPAGVRTHMLVALGAAVFVLGPMEFSMLATDLSRVIQGLVTGIGFLGAGAIIKREEKGEVEGLTTAAGIWMTAAVGLAVGLGRFGLAFVSVFFAWFVLTVIKRSEEWANRNIAQRKKSELKD